MRSRLFAGLATILLLPGLGGCEDQCSSFSPNKFNCDQIANANYAVHFTLPDQSDISLGQVEGLSNCARKASDYAKVQSVPKQYYCCMVTETSSCAEKHR